MDVVLGRFGDRRLEKGGSFCRGGWLKLGAAEFGFGVLGAIVRVKFG